MMSWNRVTYLMCAGFSCEMEINLPPCLSHWHPCESSPTSILIKMLPVLALYPSLLLTLQPTAIKHSPPVGGRAPIKVHNETISRSNGHLSVLDLPTSPTLPPGVSHWSASLPWLPSHRLSRLPPVFFSLFTTHPPWVILSAAMPSTSRNKGSGQFKLK